jgi:cellulose synthase/poly-beta-1,6-N-acetylglucosamine synthase-like glycosyltransferase
LIWIDTILLIVAIILALPVLVFSLQVLLAVFCAKPMLDSSTNSARLPVAVLMPAHNESLVIAETIQSIMLQLTSHDRLLVVADNCSDETATIARKLGAIAVERVNETQRGKGFALDFGLEFLKKTPPNIVLIIDADCVIEGGAIDKLAKTCAVLKRPVQALYLMQSQPTPNLKARIAEFAWLVKNKVRPLGFKALGLPCQLMGTGMAFLWEDLIKINLASGHIVEDMKLGVDFARMSKAPYFLPTALVTSVFPPTADAANTQRTRWEHGHLSVILNEAPSLFLEAVVAKNWQMFGLACDLIVPPLAVLTLVCVAVFVFCFVFAAQSALLVSTVLLLVLASSVLLAWTFFGRKIISFKQLCYAPIYALMKIPLYIKFFLNRQVEWVRSKRD